MRSVVALLLVIVAVASAAPLLYSDNPRVINGSYIVVLKPNTELTTRDAHIMELEESAAQVGDHSFVTFRYAVGSFVGFSARLSDKFLQTELNHPDVLYIEADQVMKVSYATQKNAEWGLARISTRTNGATSYKYNTTAGSGVDVFVIDTGIYTSNVDFGGRASAVFNSIPGESGQDLNGHGTHCSGTIGGATYGVAKKVALKGVKVLDKEGSGSNSGVIAGVDYVTNNRVQSRPTVASMSLGGGPSNALDGAVIESINSGIVYSIAAGNEDADACNSSPARVKTAVTVGATDDTDYRAYFSNWGECVDIFAPGVNINSDWIGKTTANNTISGTSMATPHVAGVLALHLSSFPSLTPQESANWLISVADKGVVIDPKGSDNFLLYSPAF